MNEWITHLVTPAIFQNWVVFTEKLNFRYKSGPTQLRISKPSVEHSHGSPEFPDQNLRQISPGVPEF